MSLLIIFAQIPPPEAQARTGRSRHRPGAHRTGARR